MAQQTCVVTVLLALLCCTLPWFQTIYQPETFCPRAKLTWKHLSTNDNIMPLQQLVVSGDE